ncbi:MAG: hypothetical protein CL908_01540 [Deltaproteobacteria bacterium]|jgi:hypothetical protein|nr:hypothetical protein [Deltaproteobacteria bacterium]
MEDRNEMTVARDHPLVRERGCRVLRRLGFVLWLSSALLVGPASARGGEVSAMGPVESGRALRCATRAQPREIGKNQYVIDRVTECAFFEALASASAPPTAAATVRLAERSCEASRAAGPLPASTAPEPTEDQRASWSRSRDRLSNAQHASSLRGVRDGIRPAPD